jgi:integrase
VKWKPPKVAEVVDRRVVVNPRQARELLTAVTYVGRTWRGRHLRAFFACMYFAALRPGEVKALRKDGCFLPASGWGRLTLSRSRPQSNRRWTDSGEAFDDRGLKHRAEEDTRPVPIPPELVTILREHIEEFGTAADGRLFSTATGGMICDTTHTWAAARTLALVPGQVASPLAGRPYDLRHGAVSLWLNGGVAATEVANRAGHSVEVLLRVYAKCIDAARRLLTGGSMKHWPSDRFTMQGSRFRRDPSVFRRLTWGNASRFIPRISRDQRQMAAGGCIWLRSVTSMRREISGHKPRSEPVFRGRSGGRGIRTHGDVAATMVFKTIAIGH